VAKRKQVTVTRKAKGKAKPGRARGPGRKGKAAAEEEAQLSLRQLQDAADLGRAWLGERHDYFGYLSRRDTTRGAPELAMHLRGDIRAKQGPDGSWREGDLPATAEALWRLLELGQTPDSPAVQKALDWLYSRRDREGAFGWGCTPTRHEQRICQHYVSGFFSAGPPERPLEVTLSNGQAATSDAAARLLASERALRSALRARPLDPRAAASITGLRGLPLYLEYGAPLNPALLVGALQAFAWTSGSRPRELEAGLELLAAEHDEDGTWPNVEFFFVVEMLLEARHPAADAMLLKSIPRLLDTQQKTGAWGRRHPAAQTWIAVLALERALQEAVEGAGAS
jgi:hypothetical protein